MEEGEDRSEWEGISAETSYGVPPVPVVPVVMGEPVDDMTMPVDTPLINRVPSARMLTCTVMTTLLPEPLGPLRVSVRVPLTAPPFTGTLPAVTWKVHVVKVMRLPASGPWVKVKVQEPKAALPLDVAPPLAKLNVVGLVKVSVAGLLPRLGSKIEPF
jgi:hypothetical protein